MLLIKTFPIELINCTNSVDHSSNSKDLTLDKCVPRLLCIPEHSMHIKAPKFKLAHTGSFEFKIVKDYWAKDSFDNL